MKGTVIIPRQGRDFEVAHRVEAGEHHIEVSAGSSFNELYWDFAASRFVAEPETYEELPEVLQRYGASWLLAFIPQLAAGSIDVSSEQLRELASTQGVILDVLTDVLANGASIETVAKWTKALVIHMKHPLTASTRAELRERFSELRYFQNAGDAHCPPDEGFIDDRAAAAISFPLRT